MSLRIFHICFITLSTLLCAGVAWWCFANDVPKIWSWAFAIVAAILPPYGVWFLRKTRKLVH
jgi:hypothetical protein